MPIEIHFEINNCSWILQEANSSENPQPAYSATCNNVKSAAVENITWRNSIFCFFLSRVIFAWCRFLSRDRTSRSSADIRRRFVGASSTSGLPSIASIDGCNDIFLLKGRVLLLLVLPSMPWHLEAQSLVSLFPPRDRCFWQMFRKSFSVEVLHFFC